MSGYTYLLLQTLPIVSAVALIFCLMGLFFGASKYRTQLKEAELAREALAGELSDLRKGQRKMTSELDEARRELRQMKGGKAGEQSASLGQPAGSPLEPAKRATDLNEPATDGASVDLGKLYESRPEQVDDLKKVRGIARVMEGKLNAAGIYTYAQIARWSDAAAAEFGTRFAIVGNIERYRWREQCAKLHEEKYHEPA